MKLRRFIQRAAMVAALLFTGVLQAETLYFIPTRDSQSGVLNRNWLSETNWYIPDSQNPGSFLPVGRFPDYNDFHDSAVLTGNALLPGSARVADLDIEIGVDFSGGALTCDTLEIAGTMGANAVSTTVTVITKMTVSGATLTATTLNLPLGTLMQMGPFATMILGTGCILNNDGQIEMVDGSQIFGVAGVTLNNTGLINATGFTIVGGPTDGASYIGGEMTLNSSGVLEADDGTLVVNGVLIGATGSLGTTAFTSASSTGQITYRTTKSSANIVVTALVLNSSLSATVGGAGLAGFPSLQMNGGSLSVGVIDPSSHILDPGHAAIMDDLDGATTNAPAPASVSGAAAIHVLSQGNLAGSLILTSVLFPKTFTGALTVDPGSTLTIGGYPSTLLVFSDGEGGQIGFRFFGGTINNSGNALLSEGAAIMDGAAVFNNLAGASLKITDDFSLDSDTPAQATHGSIVNAGVLEKSGSSSILPVSKINPQVTNTNLVKADAGTLNFSNGLTQTGGETELLGGNIDGTLTLEGGALTGAGATGNILNKAGTISLGLLPGTLTVNGSFIQEAGGELIIKLGGTTAGSGFDQVFVAGALQSQSSQATLGGVVKAELTGIFTPQVGDVFEFLSGPPVTPRFFNGLTVSGHFGALEAPVDTAAKLVQAKNSVSLEIARVGPAPISAVAGAYSGVLETNPSLEADTGSISITVSGNGGFSAALLIGGKRYIVKGRLASDGSFTGAVPKTTFTLSFALDLNNNSGLITGTLADSATGKTAQVTAAHSTFGAKNSTPLAGRYTLLLPAVQGQGVPQGEGYATVTVSSAGAIKAAGLLGDGAPFTTGAHLTSNGEWLFFLAPYAAGGSVSGVLTFRDVPAQSDLDGTLNWYRDAVVKVKPASQWPSGFTSAVNAVGSLYVAPKKGVAAIVLPAKVDNATLTVTGGDFTTAPGPFAINFPATNVLGAPAAPKFSMKLTTSTGMFHGAFPDPANARALVSFTGVLFQKLDVAGYGSGAGLCFGKPATGSATKPTAALALAANP